MTAMLTYQHPQATVPVDAAGTWIDSGRWRELGVTHWHLNMEEWRISDSARFSNDEMAVAARRKPVEGVAFTPAEVADWHVAARRKLIDQHNLSEAQLRASGLLTVEDWRSREETLFWMALHGKDVYGGLAISEARIVHLSASAMKSTSCHSSP